ncbi:MAG: ADA regulatory protein [uncultured Solirubrobacteraceae bacterium]|uniref:ADA regulatory protein n=1 Tax=uncultured Solirubrobacteraceae bacterium TaxID=1162706 RepID=A0A6J4SB31_9ACTN|nr:MAG: ADA regulatory protein [uncultured Solirubrobacteraceae bacterium]
MTARTAGTHRPGRSYTLVGADGVARPSSTPGTLGGHRTSKVYGRLDCPGALSWIARGKYVQHRVFFADEATALAAGFRPCGTCIRARYAEHKRGEMTVRLDAKQPFDWAHLAAFFVARTVPGLETMEGETYRRSGFELTIDPQGGSVTASGDIADRVRRARRMLDLDAEPQAIENALADEPLLPTRPGMRSPGVFDEYETKVRAIVGQQISVAGTRTILGRMHEQGLFPDKNGLANADPSQLPMPRHRANALIALASGEPFDEIKGVGPWTRDYVRMRTGDPDVLLATDLVVRRALNLKPKEIERRGEAWRPFRSYATHRLWSATG